MPEFNKSRKIIDVLKNESFPKCPVCGNEEFEKRMFGGMKRGKNEPFNEKIICLECGEDITKV